MVPSGAVEVHEEGEVGWVDWEIGAQVSSSARSVVLVTVALATVGVHLAVLRSGPLATLGCRGWIRAMALHEGDTRGG